MVVSTEGWPFAHPPGPAIGGEHVRDRFGDVLRRVVGNHAGQDEPVDSGFLGGHQVAGVAASPVLRLEHQLHADAICACGHGPDRHDYLLGGELVEGCGVTGCACRLSRQDAASSPGEVDATAPARPLRIAILGDSMEQFSGPSPAFREAIRNLGVSVGDIGAVGVGLAAFGRSLAHAAEVERLTLHLRMACPPDRFDEAIAEVEELMARTWMPRVEALQRVLSEGRFVSASAAFPQVASENPQVAHTGQRGWLGRWLHRMRRTR